MSAQQVLDAAQQATGRREHPAVSEGDDGSLGVRPTALIAELIVAVRQLQARVSALEAQSAGGQ